MALLFLAGVLALVAAEALKGSRSSSPPPLPPAGVGGSKYDAEDVRLAKLALFVAGQDGAGAARGPVSLFQQRVGLPQTGDIDQATHDALVAASTS